MGHTVSIVDQQIMAGRYSWCGGCVISDRGRAVFSQGGPAASRGLRGQPWFNCITCLWTSLESRLAVAYPVQTNTSQKADLPLNSRRVCASPGCFGQRGFYASGMEVERALSGSFYCRGEPGRFCASRDHLAPSLGFHTVAKSPALAFPGGGSDSDFHRSAQSLATTLIEAGDYILPGATIQRTILPRPRMS